MESENKRTEEKSKNSILRNYLLPITLISSIVVSGLVGYASSHWGQETAVSDSGEMESAKQELALMKEEMTQAREESLTIIEAEIPEIISDLETYDEDIKLISENIEIIEKSLAPLGETSGGVNMVISLVTTVNSVKSIPVVSKYSDKLEDAKVKLAEINSILLELEKVSNIQKDMQNSQKKLTELYQEYQKDKNIENLLLIDQELNSNLVYRIEDLKNLTNEANELLEFSSDVVKITNQVTGFVITTSETSKELFEKVQFWKKENNKEEVTGVDEEVVKDIETSKEEIQDLPEKLAQQSRETLTSIHIIQRELQTVEITEMVIGE